MHHKCWHQFTVQMNRVLISPLGFCCGSMQCTLACTSWDKNIFAVFRRISSVVKRSCCSRHWSIVIQDLPTQCTGVGQICATSNLSADIPVIGRAYYHVVFKESNEEQWQRKRIQNACSKHHLRRHFDYFRLASLL